MKNAKINSKLDGSNVQLIWLILANIVKATKLGFVTGAELTRASLTSRRIFDPLIGLFGFTFHRQTVAVST